MLETNADRLAFKRQILQELSDHCGGPWKEVLCEAQPRYNEMVFWVLLFEDSNLREAHQIFCNILGRHVDNMKPLEAHLSYDKFTDEGLCCVAVMEGNEGVFSTIESDDLDRPGYLLEKQSSIYDAKDSKR